MLRALLNEFIQTVAPAEEVVREESIIETPDALRSFQRRIREVDDAASAQRSKQLRWDLFK